MLAGEQVGELLGGQGLAALVEDVEVAVRGEGRQHARLVLGLVHGEGAVGTEALAVLLVCRDEVDLLEATDRREVNLH